MEAVEYFGHGQDAIGGVIDSRYQLLVLVVLAGCPAAAQSGVQRVLPVHGIRRVELVRQRQLCLDEVQDFTLSHFLLRRGMLVLYKITRYIKLRENIHKLNEFLYLMSLGNICAVRSMS